MAKPMDRRHVLAWLLMLLPACIPGASSDFARQVVNERMRAACPDRTDLEIESFIIAVETDLLRGVTKQREIEFVSDDCSARGGDADACITCAIIVVDEVYGP